MKVHIRTTNSAFEGHEKGRELARILRNLADKVESVGQPGRGDVWVLMDINGNKVGTVRR